MDSKKALLIAAGVVIAIALYLAFVNNSLIPQPTQTSTPTPTQEPDLALTVPGTYSGTLPCADCTGIDTSTTFHQDKTYSMKNTYIGTPNGNQEYTQTGRYELTTGTPFDAGATVIIVDPDRPTTRTYYWVETPTQIQQLDINKNKIPQPPNMTLIKK